MRFTAKMIATEIMKYQVSIPSVDDIANIYENLAETMDDEDFQEVIRECEKIGR